MPLSTDVLIDLKADYEFASSKRRPVRDVIVVKGPNMPSYLNTITETQLKKKRSDSHLEFSRLMPMRVIGYSSGMNELISNPFIKMDFYYHSQLVEERAKEIERENQSDSDI